MTDSQQTDAKAEPQVTFARSGSTCVITFRNPRKRNAFSEGMWAQMEAGIDAADADPDVRAIVMVGEGGNFCAGADISGLPGDADNFLKSRSFAMFERIAMLRMPTIAAIAGSCFGGGAALALACDLRFMSPTAVVGITPAKLGLVYDIATTSRLMQLVGPATTKDLLFSARRMLPDEALMTGFANRLTGDDVEAAAIEYAAAVGANAPLSVEGTKRIVEALVPAILPASVDMADRLIRSCIDSEDFAEGRRAFAERRPARFTGR